MLESPSARPEPDTASQSWDIVAPGSAALQRLIDEVSPKDAAVIQPTAYNRTYHRHNR